MFHKVVKAIKYVFLRIKIAIPILMLFPNYLRDSIKHQWVRLEESDKKILFTIGEEPIFRDDDNSGREAYYVLKAFSDGGYNVYFYRDTDFRNYYRLRMFGRLIYSIKNLKFVSKLPANPEGYIYGFDAIHPEFLKFSWKKLVYINIKKSPICHVGNIIPMPFYMFPLVYASGADENLTQYRNLNRKCRIFFGGSLSASHDSSFFMQQYPHLMTRSAGVKALIESDLDVLFIKATRDFEEFLNNLNYLKRLVVVQTDYTYPINPARWLKIVGQSDFFMCLSGTDYPMCHNAIEAMAVGSIPILAYADWFDPKLEHGKNAILYSDKEDLIKKVKMVLQMSDEEILKLRNGVLEYYDTCLAKGCLARKYEKHAQPVTTLMLFPRFVARPQIEAEGRVFVNRFEQLKAQGRC